MERTTEDTKQAASCVDDIKVPGVPFQSESVQSLDGISSHPSLISIWKSLHMVNHKEFFCYLTIDYHK